MVICQHKNQQDHSEISNQMKNNSLQAIEDIFDFLKTQEQIAIIVSDLGLYRKLQTIVELSTFDHQHSFSPEKFDLDSYKLDFTEILKKTTESELSEIRDIDRFFIRDFFAEDIKDTKVKENNKSNIELFNQAQDRYFESLKHT